MRRILAAVISFQLALSALAAAAEPLARIHFYGAPAQDPGMWSAVGIETVVCADSLAACLDKAKDAYLAFSEDSITRVSDALESPGAAALKGIVVFGTSAEIKHRIKPIKGAPPVLFLVPQAAERNTIVPARRLTYRLQNKGTNATLIFVASLESHPIHRDIVLRFMGHKTERGDFSELLEAHLKWRNPPLNNNEYRQQFKYLKSFPVTQRVRNLFTFFFRREPYLIKQWAFRRYTAFDLLAYRDDHAPNAQHITLKNLRGQEFHLDLSVFAEYEPVIIVGIDDETNMYRFHWFYKTLLEYTWQDTQQDLSIRSLGPALHFRKALPEELFVPLLLRSAIPLDGITFSDADPLAAFKSLPVTIQEVITRDNNCVYCHAMGDRTPRAHHMRADTGGPQGGYGLPLVDYSPEVMREFLRNQTHVANTIGMSPNEVKPEKLDEFEAWVLSGAPTP